MLLILLVLLIYQALIIVKARLNFGPVEPILRVFFESQFVKTWTKSAMVKHSEMGSQQVGPRFGTIGVGIED